LSPFRLLLQGCNALLFALLALIEGQGVRVILDLRQGTCSAAIADLLAGWSESVLHRDQPPAAALCARGVAAVPGADPTLEAPGLAHLEHRRVKFCG